MQMCCCRQGHTVLKPAIIAVLACLCAIFVFTVDGPWKRTLVKRVFKRVASTAPVLEPKPHVRVEHLFSVSADVSSSHPHNVRKKPTKKNDENAEPPTLRVKVKEPNRELLSAEDKDKVLFVGKYSEQLGRASRNLMRLLTVAGAMGRHVAMPFVYESRMYSGAFASPHKRRPLSAYFNTVQLNARLASRGQKEMLSVQQVLNVCPDGWGVAMLLLYAGEQMNLPMKDDRLKDCKVRAQTNPQGWAECPELIPLAGVFKEQREARHRRRDKAAARAKRRGVVIYPDKLNNVVEIEKVLRNEPCVYLFYWAGEGPKRLRLTGVTERPEGPPMLPYEMPFTQDLLKRAASFKAKRLPSSYLAVHLRTEALMKFGGAKRVKLCITKAAELVRNSLQRTNTTSSSAPKEPAVFLLTDLQSNGSDTMADQVEDVEARDFLEFIKKTIPGRHVYFDGTGLVDKGMVSIVQLSIAADADMLFAAGGGNFQEWIVKLRQHRHPSLPPALRTCFGKPGKPLEGWS